MKTLVVIEVEHTKPLPHLAEMIAQRAYAMDGVDNVVVQENVAERVAEAFSVRQKIRTTLAEINAQIESMKAALK
jgi:hypothetical protein